MVHENLPMEMSPEWKAITKCESRIEALEQKVDLLIVARISLTKRIIDHEERMQKLEQTIERHGEMLVEDEDRYDKLESVLKKSLTEIGNYLDTNRFEYLIKELSGGEVMIIEPEEPEEYEDPFNEKPPELIYPERDFVPIKKSPEPSYGDADDIEVLNPFMRKLLKIQQQKDIAEFIKKLKDLDCEVFDDSSFDITIKIRGLIKEYEAMLK